MGKVQDFLISKRPDVSGTTEVVVGARFVDDKGKPIPFTIKAITEEENKRIRKECEKTTFNKRTRQKEVETDQNKYMNRLVLACTVDPNFKDAELQKTYGVMGDEALLNTLLLPGEYAELLLAVQDVNGFDADINDLMDEAKNSSGAKKTEKGA